MDINASRLPCDEQTFLRRYGTYKAAMEAHKYTVGVPAPFPEYECFRVAYERGEDIVVLRDELTEQAKQANRDALAELDALKAQVAQLQTDTAQLKAETTP